MNSKTADALAHMDDTAMPVVPHAALLGTYLGLVTSHQRETGPVSR